VVLLILAASALGSCLFSQTVSPAPSSTPTVQTAAGPTSTRPNSPATVDVPPAPVATAASAPATPIRLTSDGCCVLPFWGPDSAAVYALNRPASGVLGIYAFDLEGGPPSLVQSGAVEFSPDLAWTASREGGVVSVRESGTDQSWRVPSDGRMIHFSPRSDWVAWQIQSSNVAYLDRRRWTLELGSLASHEVSSPLSGIGGGFVGWGPDEKTLLFSGRQVADGPAGLWRSSLTGQDAELLFPSERLRSPLVSPNGGWVALTVAFSGDPSQDGLWVVSTQTGVAFKAPFFGAYRWRSEGSLLVIPLEAGRAPARLLDVDAETEQTVTLPLGQGALADIANNTWEISPDGRWLVYLSAADGNLWLVRLPDGADGA
jgi:hypothetical protein